jgi:hypothetical protein
VALPRALSAVRALGSVGRAAFRPLVLCHA